MRNKVEIKSLNETTGEFAYRLPGQKKVKFSRSTEHLDHLHESIPKDHQDSFRIGRHSGKCLVISKIKKQLNKLWARRYLFLLYFFLVSFSAIAHLQSHIQEGEPQMTIVMAEFAQLFFAGAALTLILSVKHFKTQLKSA